MTAKKLTTAQQTLQAIFDLQKVVEALVGNVNRLNERIERIETALTGPVPVIDRNPAILSPTEQAFARQANWDGKINAIKEHRARTGASLGEPKVTVENWIRDNGIPYRTN